MPFSSGTNSPLPARQTGFPTPRWRRVVSGLLLLIVLSGCSVFQSDLAELTAFTPTPKPPTRRPAITPVPTITPTVTPNPTLPTAAPTATATATPISLDEIEVIEPFAFEYPSVLIRNSSPRFNQPQGNMLPFSKNTRSDAIYPGVPDILVIDLALVGQSRLGQLIVVTYADERGNIYDAFGSGEREALLKLRARVGKRENLEPRSSFIPEAFVSYVNLSRGAAVRGIQYDPTGTAAEAVGDGNLYYSAEGIIDERYYFQFRFPVGLAEFPDGIALDGGSLAAKSAVDQTLGRLEQEGSALFWPQIGLLDDMVASLSLTNPLPANTPPTSGPINTPQPPPTATPTATRTPTPPGVTPIPPPSPTPTGIIMTIEPVPTNFPGCSNFIAFVADETVPDGSRFAPGTTFVKTWRVVNDGTCHFNAGYSLSTFLETMAIISIEPVPVISAGQKGEISVVLRAPETPGSYRMDWQMVPPDDGSVDFQEPFGLLYVDIVVDPDMPPTAVP